MKKITLDFENETVELHFDGQNGVEHFPGLKELEQPILSLLGYQKVDMRPVADAVNAYVNGQISEQEFRLLMTAACLSDPDAPMEPAPENPAGYLWSVLCRGAAIDEYLPVTYGKGLLG